jgi:hypothetical protein
MSIPSYGESMSTTRRTAPGECEGADQQRCHDQRITRREKAEAHKQNKEPEDQDNDEWILNML